MIESHDDRFLENMFLCNEFVVSIYTYIRICKLYIFADHPAVHPAGRGLHGLAEGVPRPPPHLQAIEDTQDEHCVDSGTAPLVSQEASAARRRLRLNVWVLFTHTHII